MKKVVLMILSIMMLVSLSACNSVKSKIKINETPAAKMEKSIKEYKDPSGRFTCQLPEGWEVTTAGDSMYYWIRLYDPEMPDLQVFALLKTECLLRNQRSKNYFNSNRGFGIYYQMFADMIVVEKVEDFYKNFMDFCAYMAYWEPSYAGFEYPQIDEFEVIEKYPLNSILQSVAIDDALIHGNYVNPLSYERCEGMFTGSLCLGFISDGLGANMMYNIGAVTAPYGLLSEYESVLATVYSSITYSDSLLQQAINDSNMKAKNASELNKILQETSSIITEGWNARQESYDIMSEKWSDSMLGYERVYDVETNEVYKTTSDFLEIENVDKYYKPITDDMYSLPVTGYIELK